MSEQVLVLPRALVPGGCEFRGIRPAGSAELAELKAALAAHGRFVDRASAEVDPTHKQLIPYVLLRDGQRVFLMQRTDAGGDPRLHGRASIGIGGHVNPIDGSQDPLGDGLLREWAEELVADWQPEFQLVGLLNDDSNPVGAVHLGVVFDVEADGRAVTVRETDKLRGGFVDAGSVADAWPRLETWSQLVAEALVHTPMGV